MVSSQRQPLRTATDTSASSSATVACRAVQSDTETRPKVPDNGRALLCTSVTASTVEAALLDIEEANASGADVLELRLDFYTDFDAQRHLRQLMSACKLPFIVTYRPKWEGGLYEGEEAARLRTLRQAAELGAPFIDVEWLARDAFASGDEPLPAGTRLIMSHHNFEKTLEKAELRRIEAGMRAAGADIAKIAMTAADITDAWTMIELLKEKTGPMIALSMGERGVTTRILATKYGGFLTFGALGAGRESAPGQPTVSQLKHMYRCNLHTADTKVYGIIGNPVKHSRSPVLHNAAMARDGYNGVYVPLLVDDMDAFAMAFADADWAGFSVTIPHKEAACRLSAADDVAAKIGAVNTLVRTPAGGLEGHNTDWDAAISAVERGLRGGGTSKRPLEGLTAVVLGTGGAARALAFGAAERGANVIIAGRNAEKAAGLSAQVGASAARSVTATTIADVQAGVLPAADVLLNTTPLGMVGEREAETPVPQDKLSQYKLVFDAVYTPLETRLLKEAKAAGCIVVDGLEMFVGQAAEQYVYFTGLEPPKDLMREVVLDSLKL